MRIAALALLALASCATVGRAETVIRAERRFAGHYEHFTVTFESGKLVATTNSNFLCIDAKAPRLGRYSRDKNERWAKTERYFAALASKLAGKAGLNIAPPEHVQMSSPHETRVFLNDIEVTTNQVRKQPILRQLTEACDELVGWKREDGPKTLDATTSCSIIAGARRCEVSSWGVIWSMAKN